MVDPTVDAGGTVVSILARPCNSRRTSLISIATSSRLLISQVLPWLVSLLIALPTPAHRVPGQSLTTRLLINLMQFKHPFPRVTSHLCPNPPLALMAGQSARAQALAHVGGENSYRGH